MSFRTATKARVGLAPPIRKQHRRASKVEEHAEPPCFVSVQSVRGRDSHRQRHHRNHPEPRANRPRMCWLLRCHARRTQPAAGDAQPGHNRQGRSDPEAGQRLRIDDTTCPARSGTTAGLQFLTARNAPVAYILRSSRCNNHGASTSTSITTAAPTGAAEAHKRPCRLSSAHVRRSSGRRRGPLTTPTVALIIPNSG